MSHIPGDGVRTSSDGSCHFCRLTNLVSASRGRTFRSLQLRLPSRCVWNLCEAGHRLDASLPFNTNS